MINKINKIDNSSATLIKKKGSQINKIINKRKLATNTSEMWKKSLKKTMDNYMPTTNLTI